MAQQLNGILVFFMVVLAGVGCSQGSGNASNNQGSGGGPIDGTYTLSDAKCNGSTAQGSLSVPNAPVTYQYLFANTSGSFIYSTPGCTATIAMSFKYAGNTVTATQAGTSFNCIPSNCSLICGAKVSSSGNREFTFSKKGNALTLTATASIFEEPTSRRRGYFGIIQREENSIVILSPPNFCNGLSKPKLMRPGS